MKRLYQFSENESPGSNQLFVKLLYLPEDSVDINEDERLFLTRQGFENIKEFWPNVEKYHNSSCFNDWFYIEEVFNPHKHKRIKELKMELQNLLSHN